MTLYEVIDAKLEDQSFSQIKTFTVTSLFNFSHDKNSYCYSVR